jgi:hypothetical protein
MRHPDLPSTAQRLQAAEVSGEVQHLLFAENIDDDAAVARLREITTDAVVLGHALGMCLVHGERADVYAPVVRWLRAAGAHEGQAQLKAEWLRQQITEGRYLL